MLLHFVPHCIQMLYGKLCPNVGVGHSCVITKNNSKSIGSQFFFKYFENVYHIDNQVIFACCPL